VVGPVVTRFLEFRFDVLLDHAQQRPCSFLVVLPERVENVCAHARAVLRRLQSRELSGDGVEEFERLFT
jgi:hypothetical protein